MDTLIALVPYVAPAMGALGLSVVAVGIWRLSWHGPRVGASGFSLVSVGLSLLFLAGWALATYKKSSQGRLDYCKSTLVKGLASALEMYAQEHGGRLPERLSDLVPDYLKFIPVCPAAGRDTYTEGYRLLKSSRPGEAGYIVSCSGRNHQGAGVTSAGLPTFHWVLGAYCDDISPPEPAGRHRARN